MNDATEHIPSIHRPLRRTLQQCHRTLLVESLMWSRVIVLRHVLGEDPVEMPLIQNKELI